MTIVQHRDTFAAPLQLPVTFPLACRVLVVDDDPACRSEYAELVAGLGYGCVVADQASSALRALAEDATIGIVLTDLQMPAMDGFTLLDEIAARFLSMRPLVTVVVTGQSSIDSAVRAMRSNAVDFLCKPVTGDELSAVLRRASARWGQQIGQFQLMALARAGYGHNHAIQSEPERPTPQAPSLGQTPTTEELIAFVRSIMRSRQRRSEFLDITLFADPAWDILLDLTLAALKQTPTATSSVCAATQVPLSTALRHVRQLVASGLVTRRPDRNDKRRTLLALEDSVLAAMIGYLTAVWRHDRALGR